MKRVLHSIFNTGLFSSAAQRTSLRLMFPASFFTAVCNAAPFKTREENFSQPLNPPTAFLDYISIYSLKCSRHFRSRVSIISFMGSPCRFLAVSWNYFNKLQRERRNIAHCNSNLLELNCHEYFNLHSPSRRIPQKSVRYFVGPLFSNRFLVTNFEFSSLASRPL